MHPTSLIHLGGSCHLIAPLEFFEFLLTRFNAGLATTGEVMCAVAHGDVPIADVETTQVITGVLRIVDVLVHHVGGTACIGCIA
jgi:hypothetical protein